MFSRISNKISQFKTVQRRWERFRKDLEFYDRNIGPVESTSRTGSDLDAFSKVVQIVEIEPHNFCNRTCSFCGNSMLDRKSKMIPMADSVYTNILGSLASINYNKEIRFARYSEPMAREEIFKMISMARASCPDSYLKIITNGDYLNPESFCRLKKAGLNRVHVSVYLPNKVAWTQSEAIKYVNRLIRRIDGNLKSMTTGLGVVEGVMEFPGMEVTFNCVNYSDQGFDRGEEIVDLIDREFIRIDPCQQIFRNVTIDFDGTVMPCCNLRGDDPGHAKYMFGKITDDCDLFDVWYNDKAHAWRKGLSNFGKKQSPCRSCTQLTLGPVNQAITRLNWARYPLRRGG